MTNEQQILNLIGQYTYYVDQAKFDKVGELFANGKIITPGSTMEGKEGVAKQLVKNLQVYSDGTLKTAHITTNTVLEIHQENNEASAVSYLTIFQQDADRDFPLQPIAIGRYHDTFKRTDGNWHFSVRELIITLPGDLSHHANSAATDPDTIKQNGK